MRRPRSAPGRSSVCIFPREGCANWSAPARGASPLRHGRLHRIRERPPAQRSNDEQQQRGLRVLDATPPLVGVCGCRAGGAGAGASGALAMLALALASRRQGDGAILLSCATGCTVYRPPRLPAQPSRGPGSGAPPAVRGSRRRGLPAQPRSRGPAPGAVSRGGSAHADDTRRPDTTILRARRA